MDDADPGTPEGSDGTAGSGARADADDALEIDPDDLVALLDGDGGGDDGTEPRLIDVRPRGAYARGHLPGSENVPLRELPSRAAEFDGADRVVCVCREGIASLQAARLLAAYEGVERVESLAGGIDAWPDGLVTGGGNDGGGEDGDGDGGAAPF